MAEHTDATDSIPPPQHLPAHSVIGNVLGGTLLVALPFWFIYRKNS